MFRQPRARDKPDYHAAALKLRLLYSTIAELEHLRARFGALFSLNSAAAEALLFRVGFADECAKRSFRRPLSDVCRSR